MKKSLIITLTSLTLTLAACGSTKDVAQEQQQSNQRNELFITAKTSVDNLIARLAQAKTDNLAYYAERLYKDALDEMEEVNDEFDDIRYAPQEATQNKVAEIQSYILKTNNYLDQAYLIKKSVDTTLAETNQQIARLKEIGADQLYPRTFGNFSKKVDSMVEDIADGDIKDAQDDQAELLPQLYALESKAVKHIKLSALQKELDDLRRDRAHRTTPISYQKAVASLQSAESIIIANPRATIEIDAAVEQVKLEIAHVKHIVLEIKSLAQVKSKDRETYILHQENQIHTITQALNSADLRAQPINEQYNQLAQQAKAIVAEQQQSQEQLTSLSNQLSAKEQLLSANNQDGKEVVKKLDEKLAYIGQLEQQLATAKLMHQKALLTKDQELMKIKQKLQQLELTALKKQVAVSKSAPAPAPTVAPTVAPAVAPAVTPDPVPVVEATPAPTTEIAPATEISPAAEAASAVPAQVPAQ